MKLYLAALVLAPFLSAAAFAAAPKVIPLWPEKVPGLVAARGAEADESKSTDNLIAGRPLIRLGNVSVPTLTIYSPDAAKNTGAAVVVCPGGGYNILAWDLEGTEVCEWLNSIGVTGVLLKYRVPVPRDAPEPFGPLQDVQRALGLVRSQAKELSVDPARIGVLGFSAGAHLSALVSNHYSERTYPAVDAADQVSCKPDFVVLVYPGGLAREDHGWDLDPEMSVSAAVTPPTFIVMAEDDPVHVENATVYYSALQKAKVSAEMHLYPSGGHGYGLRRTDNPVTAWPDRVADWMKASGWLKR